MRKQSEQWKKMRTNPIIMRSAQNMTHQPLIRKAPPRTDRTKIFQLFGQVSNHMMVWNQLTVWKDDL